VDVIGSEEAIKRLKPYYIHSGRAGGLVFQNMTGIPSNDPVASIWGMGPNIETMLEGTWGPGYLAKDGSLMMEFQGCITKGLYKEACLIWCGVAVCTSHMELSPEYEAKLLRSMSYGDPCCVWEVHKRGTAPLVEEREEFRPPPEFVPPFTPDEEMKVYLSSAWTGELWILATRTLVDTIGPDAALQRLGPYMRDSGRAVGLKLAKNSPPGGRSLETITSVVSTIHELHQKRLEVTAIADRTQGTIRECPFAGSAPPLLCMQYEAFFNGICEAIDPAYEFLYERTMVGGDAECGWQIRRKDSKGEPPVKLEQEPLKVLRLRLARGEITKEEYLDLKTLLE
jgi:hypothetical protein